MANGKALDELRRLTDSDSGLNERKLIKIAFELMDDFDKHVRELVGMVKDLTKKIDDISEKNDEYHKTYPPLTWLLRHKTRETLGALILMFILTFIMIAFAPLIGRYVWDYFGLPPLPR